jgi:hypothetical protein
MLRFAVTAAGRSIRRRLRHRGRLEHWFIAIRKRTSHANVFETTRDLPPFRPVDAPRGHFYADPFLMKKNGRNYVFFEDYRYWEEKGVICGAEVLADGAVGDVFTVLEKPYHLSYPCIFEHGGEIFLIPESAGARTVELYWAKEFPAEWEMVKILKQDMLIVDVTPLFHDGRCWFFGAVTERGQEFNDELFLFHADSLTGSWVSHQMNPVVSDVRRARPAGSVVLHHGELLRPSQDCSLTYGGAVHVNRISRLNPLEYQEQTIRTIFPDWSPGLIGTHTINANGDFEFIDGKKLVSANEVL